jgi:hypothetical protein
LSFDLFHVRKAPRFGLLVLFINIQILSCLFLTCIHEESSNRKFNSSTYFEKNNHPPALVQAIFLIMMIDTPLRPPSHMMKWASSSFIFKHCFHLELNGPLSALLLHT